MCDVIGSHRTRAGAAADRPAGAVRADRAVLLPAQAEREHERTLAREDRGEARRTCLRPADRVTLDAATR